MTLSLQRTHSPCGAPGLPPSSLDLPRPSFSLEKLPGVAWPPLPAAVMTEQKWEEGRVLTGRKSLERDHDHSDLEGAGHIPPPSCLHPFFSPKLSTHPRAGR